MSRIVAFSVIWALSFGTACSPRRVPAGPSPAGSVPVATVTPIVPPSAGAVRAAGTPTVAPTPAPPPSVWTLPEIRLPGMPSSPRQALVGRWSVAGIDGKPVASTPTMAHDPLDPASYAAGTTVVFTADTVTVSRLELVLLQRKYQVISEIPPLRVTIDAGYGNTNVDFNLDGSATWVLPSNPPHVLSLIRVAH